VGQPRDRDPRACYVIYDLERRFVFFRRVGYDMETAQKTILDSGLPSMSADRLADGR
jgi:diadenosine tetraphosphatase ApaH/serine/threonine PP2A family protein phosphatase